MEIIDSPGGIAIINDSYNANPQSMQAALKVLANFDRGEKRVAVLGDMLELGRRAQAAHREIGRFVNEQEIDHLVAVGNLGRYIAQGALKSGMPKNKVNHYSSKPRAFSKLKKLRRPGTCFLIKGSRAMHMEDIVENLRESQNSDIGSSL